MKILATLLESVTPRVTDQNNKRTLTAYCAAVVANAERVSRATEQLYIKPPFQAVLDMPLFPGAPAGDLAHDVVLNAGNEVGSELLGWLDSLE